MNLYNQGKFYFFLLLTLVVLAATGVIEAQAQADLSEKPYLDPRLTAADTLYISRRYADALSAYSTIAKVFAQEENWPGYVMANAGKMNALIELGDTSDFKARYDSLINLTNDKLGTKDPEVAYLNLAYGYYFAKSVMEYDEAEIYMLKALELTKAAGGETTPIWININYRLTFLYAYNLDDIYVARDYLQVLIDNSQKLSKGAKAFTYYTMATISRQFADYEKAEIYSLKALQAYAKIEGINLSFAYTMLANVYMQQGKYGLANENYFIAIDVVKEAFGATSYRLVDIYLNQILCYDFLGLPQKAIEVGEEALRVLQINEAMETDNAQIVYENTGVAYLALGQYERASTYFKNALYLVHKLEYALESDASSQLTHLGETFEAMDMADSALYFYHEALSIGFDNDLMDDLLTCPPASAMVLNIRNIETVSLKANALLKSGAHRSDIRIMEAALQHYFLADSLLTDNRLSVERDGSKLFLLEKNKNIYESAIRCANLLYGESADVKYLDDVQYFFEASKARILFETVIESEQYSLLPDSIAQANRELSIDYNFYLRERKGLATSDEDGEINEELLTTVNDRIFEISQEQEKLAQFINIEYPNIKTSRSEFELATMEAVKTYAYDRQIIEFFWGDTHIYAMGVSSVETKILEIPLDADLLEHLDVYARVLRIEVPDPFDETAFKAFHQSAYFLYQRLIEPIIQHNQEKVLIIPDGLLSSIPFESLIKTPYDQNNIDYKSLDYLINTFEIGYDHSLSLAFDTQEEQVTIDDPKILALGFSSAEDAKYAGPTREGVIELPGTTQEIAAIGELIGNGDYLLGQEASESFFIEHGTEYDMLHLAIHGIGDENERLGSKLIFKSAEQGYDSLYAYEMFNLNLKAELAVLSACETGVGKLQKGEGVFNLARGFTYAGCPSVVMSLWKINDAVSAQIMSEFYSKLNDGDNVDQSLRSAKLDYLNKADQFSAHPSQWAAFVHFGAQSTFNIPHRSKWTIYVSLLIGFAILTWYVVRLRKKGSL